MSVFNQLRTFFMVRFQCQDPSTNLDALHSRHPMLLVFFHERQNIITIQGIFATYRDNHFYEFMTLVELLSLLITADNRMTTLSHLSINSDATELANAF